VTDGAKMSLSGHMRQQRKPLKTVRDWPVYVSTVDWRLETHSSSTKIFTRKPDYHLTARHGIKLTTSASTTDGDRHCQSSEYSVVQMWAQTTYYLLVGKIRLNLKRSAKKKPSRPYAVAQLKDTQTSRRYEALKPFYSTSGRPVSRLYLGTRRGL